MSRKICFQGIRTQTPPPPSLDPDPPLDHLGKHWQFQLKRSIISFSMVIDSFKDVFFGFCVELRRLPLTRAFEGFFLSV